MAYIQEIILEDNKDTQQKAAITLEGLLEVTTYVKDEVGCLVRIGGIILSLNQFKKLNDFFYERL
jgi:hypothetical protein